MAVSTGTENEAHMRLLEMIKELNSNDKYPSFNELLQQNGIQTSFLKLDVSELVKKGYIEELSVPDDSHDGYSRIGHKITGKGQHALERFTSQARHFVSRLEEIYGKGGNDDLYKALEDNRDLLRFAYYKELITKAQIEKMAKKLEINVERIWWGDSQGQATGDVGVFPVFP